MVHSSRRLESRGERFVPETKDLTTLVAEVVAAYVGSHKVDSSELPNLIRDIRASLDDPSGSAEKFAESNARKPPVPVAESIMPDYLICLEDGKRFKTMKRHIRRLGLSPEEYREKWGLPGDYPMVAPNYGKRRSRIAKKIGLGLNNTSLAKRKPLYEQSDIAVTAMRSMGDAVVCTDVQCAITFMNPVAERLTGWDALQAAGKCFIEVFKLQERASRTNIYPARRCIDQASPVVVEVGTVLLSKSGEELDVGFSASPIRTPAGDVVGSVLIFNNLTGTPSSPIR